MRRKTLTREISIAGITLHSGQNASLTLLPAEANTGTLFRRVDLDNQEISARFDQVHETRLGTVIRQGNVRVGVIEHLMAALSGADIDDVLVLLDGDEPPILDGDALSYLHLLDAAGTTELDISRTYLQILKTVTVEQGQARASLHPADRAEYAFQIDFPLPIGQQNYIWQQTPESFRRDIAPARTFGFVQELDALHKAGLGRGASLENTLAIEGGALLISHLQRFEDEFVRHKILDAVGDLALAGGPLLARFEGLRSGHALNNALLREVFSDSSNYRWITAP